MDNRARGFRLVMAIMMAAWLVLAGAVALADADPIRVSSLSEPQSVISEQDVSVTIKIYNSGQTDMQEDITLFNPEGISVDKYGGLKGEQSVTYTGTWHVTQDQIEKGKINYYIRYTVDTGNGPTETTRTVPVTIKTESVTPQLSATYSITPAVARKGQEVTLAYTLSNTGNIELRNIEVENKGISSKKLTAASLSVGEKVTLEETFTMGEAEVVSNPTVTYQAAGSNQKLTISDMARRTVTLAEDGLEVELTADKQQNIYPGERVKLKLRLKNSGESAYTALDVRLSDGTSVASGVELAPGATYDQDIEWAVQESGAVLAEVSGKDANGESVGVSSQELALKTQDTSTALILDVRAQAETSIINSEPAVVRFGLVVKNIGQTDATTLTVQEAGTTVATIPSLPSGESRTLVFDLQTSIAGQIQFTVTGKDAEGNDRSYTSNIIALTYVAPTPEPTATPAPTAVPPTPSPVPTATPEPTLREILSEHVSPTVLYTAAGGLAAVLVILVAVNAVKSAKRRKRLAGALDTISLSPDVRNHRGMRRRKEKKDTQDAKTPDKQNEIVSAPELTEEETRRASGHEETRRRRAAADLSEEETLRVAPVDQRPEFVAQGKVDDSKTRIFGKLDMEAEQAEQASAEPETKAEQAEVKAEEAETADPEEQTIRLSREQIDEIRRKDTFEAKGKKRSEMKPMKKKKKGLFGRHKDEDDDFIEEGEVPGHSDDDDFFE